MEIVSPAPILPTSNLCVPIVASEDKVVLRFACCSLVVVVVVVDKLFEETELVRGAVAFAVSLSSTEDDIVVNPSSAFPFAFEMVTIALFASALPLLIMLMFTLFRDRK